MNSFLHFLKFYFKCEIKRLDQLIGPMLFSITTIVLFQFAYDHLDSGFKETMTTSQFYLSTLMGTFIFFLRSFSLDTEDGFITHIQVSSVNKTAWFCAKLVQVFCWLSILGLVNLAAIALFWSAEIMDWLSFEMIATAVVNVLGTSALGLLLIFTVSLSSLKEVIFSLLYFPLITPLFICSIQCWSENQKFVATTDLSGKWALATCAIAMIFVTLSILLIGEVMKTERQT